MIKVLFLSAWYPNRYDAMAGLFVRKHAEAVSRYCEVQVLYVHADKNIKRFEIEFNNHHEVSEVTVYYPNANFILKLINYFLAYLKGFSIIKRRGFNPDILHSNILTRTVFIAYLYKITHKIPYVISEHWSRYLPIRNGYHGFVRKFVTKLVVKNSSAVLPASGLLQNAMISHKLYHPNYKIVHNVVDDIFFRKREKKTDLIKRFLHISCFDEKAKNVTGILNAVKRLSLKRTDFQLIIIGTGVDFDMVYLHYKMLNFPEGLIKFVGEKTPVEVAEWFSQSDCFILFSNYETAGVVIAESMASGIPIISTKVGIAEEFVNIETGILIDSGDEHSLTESMNQTINDQIKYNTEKIKQQARIFSFEVVGMNLFNIYKEICKNKSNGTNI